MKKYIKLLIASAIAVSTFIFAFAFCFNTYAAEEQPTDTPEDTTETNTDTNEEELYYGTGYVRMTEESINPETTDTGLTEDEKNKINSLIDFIQSLSEDELIKYIDEVKAWAIGIGLAGGISLLAAITALFAAVMKLRNEKIRNSQLTEQAKNEKIAESTKWQEQLEAKTNELKMLFLDFINGLDDEEKKKVESNTLAIKERISSTLQELENKE